MEDVGDGEEAAALVAFGCLMKAAFGQDSGMKKLCILLAELELAWRDAER